MFVLVIKDVLVQIVKFQFAMESILQQVQFVHLMVLAFYQTLVFVQENGLVLIVPFQFAMALTLLILMSVLAMVLAPLLILAPAQIHGLVKPVPFQCALASIQQMLRQYVLEKVVAHLQTSVIVFTVTLEECALFQLALA